MTRNILQKKSRPYMNVRRNIARGALLAAALLLGQAPGLVQSAFAQNAGAGDMHKTGDWTVRCAPSGGCQMFQADVDQKSHAAVAGIVINFVPKSNAYFAHFIVPLGVRFTDGLSITIGSFQAAHLKFKRCERDGCYVEGMIPPAMMNAMQAGGPRGEMDVVFINGRKIALPIGLDGFSDGLALLKKSAGGDTSGKH
jgi:invasion protein IalB